MRAALRPLPSRGPAIGRALIADLPLKATALLVALVLWFGVAASAAREITTTFDGRIPVEKPDVPAGWVIRAPLGDVSVRLRGQESIVRRLTVADLRATVDLTGVDVGAGGAIAVPVQVTPSDPHITVVEVTPSSVGVKVERVTSRTFVVQATFANGPPRGYGPGKVAVTPAEARITGPESVVGSVSAVFVTVRFGDVPVDVVQTALPIPVDAAGAAVEGTSIEPASIEVRVPVLPLATTRTVPIVPTVRGDPAVGFWVSRIVSSPLAVTVSGSQSALAALDRLDTVPLDVTGIDADRALTTQVLLPAGISLVNPAAVTVRVTVAPLTGTKPFQVAVTVANLGSGFVAETSPQTVSVVLAGALAALSAVTPGEVVATADAATLVAGAHEVNVAIRAPAGLAVQTVQPARATLTIKSR